MTGAPDARRSSARATATPVTVVIPTRNRPQLVAVAVRSVLDAEPPPAELIVVDQSDEPLTLPAQTEGPTTVRHLRTLERGLSRALNRGVAAAAHETVLVTHDDALVDVGWVAAMANASRQHGPDVLLTGRVVSGDPEAPGGFAPSLAPGTMAAVYRGRTGVDVLKPLNMGFHRTLYEALGGFDPRLGPGTAFPGAEDADFGFRTLESGRAIAFVPDARVVHRAWRPGRTFLRLRWSYGFAHGAFYCKHLRRGDRYMAERFARDVVRRARRFPARIVREGLRALGDPVFVTANLAGATAWAVRYRAAAPRPSASAAPPVEEDRESSYRVRIPPVADAGTDRPTWSIMIPTYNCSEFLERTLRSVLTAIGDRTDVHIEVVDDGSTADDPGAVVRVVGDGRVQLFRQAHNVGHTANFDTCLLRSRGVYVHLLHGDDLVCPGFYDAAERVFTAHPGVGAAFCRHQVVDENDHLLHVARPLREHAGVLHGWLDEIAVGNRLQASTMTVRREVYERVGGFDRRIPSYGEDWEMWVRIAAATQVHYDPTPRAIYRIRRAGLTGASLRSGSNIAQLVLVARLNRAALPPGRGDELMQRANVATAKGALRRALRMWDDGVRQTAVAQARAALRASRSPEVCWALGVAVGRATFRSSRRSLQRLGIAP